MKRTLFAMVLMIMAVAPALAEQDHTPADIENLQRRIEALERERPEKPPFSLGVPGRYLNLSGLVEVEGFYGESEGGGDESDLTLATAYLNAGVRITENIGGYIAFLYEEGDTPLELDEAVVSLACPRQIIAGGSLTLKAGRMYLPFGAFRSFFISDPLTLELGETRNTAVLLGWKGAFSLSVGAFSGEVDDRESQQIGSWVLALEAEPREGLVFGLSLLSDLAESDAQLVSAPESCGDSVPAVSAFLSWAGPLLALEAEFLTAVDSFGAAALDAAGGEGVLTGSRPRAWNVEIAWMPAERWALGVKADRADDFLNDLRRYGAVISRGLFEQTVLGLEYLYGKDDIHAETHTLTAQLALEF